MTIEEKAKAYDEALEMAKNVLETDLHESGVWAIKKIFPELKESKDERIKKAILGLVYLDGIEPILTKYSITRSDILTYLEKQTEQKPLEYLPKEKINDIIDKLTDLSYSKLIPFKSRESQKIDEISSDILGLLDYPIEKKQEVDLEKELQAFLCNYDYEFDDDPVPFDIAKHFYELGLKARKKI